MPDNEQLSATAVNITANLLYLTGFSPSFESLSLNGGNRTKQKLLDNSFRDRLLLLEAITPLESAHPYGNLLAL
jgi:hypothetical protein